MIIAPPARTRLATRHLPPALLRVEVHPDGGEHDDVESPSSSDASWGRLSPTQSIREDESLKGSPTVQKLQAITELDLDELLAIDPPRGYGRD